MERFRRFAALVVGDNPEEVMKKYDSTVEVQEYPVYKFSDASELKKRHIKAYEEMLKNKDKFNFDEETLKEQIALLEEMDDTDFYVDLTMGLRCDPKTMDAYSTKNPDGRYDFCNIGKNYSTPLTLKDGTTVSSALKGDVDWEKMHLNNRDTYKRVWEIVVEKSEPTNDDEREFLKNMGNRVDYFMNFKDKEDYIMQSTSFWYYAFVDEKGWVECDMSTPQEKWVKEFHQRFIANLPDDARLTIYECGRK